MTLTCHVNKDKPSQYFFIDGGFIFKQTVNKFNIFCKYKINNYICT